MPVEIKELPTTRYQVDRDYLVRWPRRMYGLRPFQLQVTLTDNIEALLQSIGASREAIRRGSLSFEADEEEPKMTVDVHSEAEALKVVGESAQTKRLNAEGDTDFTFLLQPKTAEDLTFVVRIMYTRTAFQNEVSKETVSVTKTEGDEVSTARTVTDSHKINSQSEKVELAALTLSCSVRNVLRLTSNQVSIISKLGTFLLAIGVVVVWRLVFPASFNSTQAFGYLVLGLANALGLTIVDPGKVRLPWVSPEKEAAEEA
ncbi:MAG: hypothetical protein ACE5LU_21060 [Anaerolineae bacterium]